MRTLVLIVGLKFKQTLVLLIPFLYIAESLVIIFISQVIED